jgi:hypothetical protein
MYEIIVSCELRDEESIGVTPDLAANACDEPVIDDVSPL